MVKRTYLATAPLIMFLMAWAIVRAGEPLAHCQVRPCPEPSRSAFRYIITYNNEVDGVAPDQGKATFRVVEVLLDANSFSEATLRQLFELLSNRFPKSDKLFVHVHTSLEDVYTPEEAEQVMPSSRCNSLRRDKHAWAIYNRSNEYEGFDYDTNGSGTAVRTVRLKGRP